MEQTKNEKLEARQNVAWPKKFTQKYLQVIELFKKPIYVAAQKASFVLFKERTHIFNFQFCFFLLVTKRKEIN